MLKREKEDEQIMGDETEWGNSKEKPCMVRKEKG